MQNQPGNQAEPRLYSRPEMQVERGQRVGVLALPVAGVAVGPGRRADVHRRIM